MKTLTIMDLAMIAKIGTEAGNSAKNLLESNIPLILADLGKVLKESDDNEATIPVKIKLSIHTHDSKVFLDTAIEWERKKVEKDQGIPIKIDMNQPELFEVKND